MAGEQERDDHGRFAGPGGGGGSSSSSGGKSLKTQLLLPGDKVGGKVVKDIEHGRGARDMVVHYADGSKSTHDRDAVHASVELRTPAKTPKTPEQLESSGHLARFNDESLAHQNAQGRSDTGASRGEGLHYVAKGSDGKHWVVESKHVTGLERRGHITDPKPVMAHAGSAGGSSVGSWAKSAGRIGRK